MRSHSWRIWIDCPFLFFFPSHSPPCADVALHHSARKQTSTTTETWAERWRRTLREPPTFQLGCSDVVSHENSPSSVYSLSAHWYTPSGACLLLRTTTDTRRREREQEIAISLTQYSWSTRHLTPSAKLRKNGYVKSRQNTSLNPQHPGTNNPLLTRCLCFQRKIFPCIDTSAHPSPAGNWRSLSKSGSGWVFSAAMEIIKNEQQSVADRLPFGSS